VAQLGGISDQTKCACANDRKLIFQNSLYFWTCGRYGNFCISSDIVASKAFEISFFSDENVISHYVSVSRSCRLRR